MSNSLVAVHPELIVEWSDRNLPLTPDSVTFGSNKKVWWKGTCGHEWQTSIKDDIKSRLNRYENVEGFTAVWVWAEKVSDTEYEIYIGYC